MPNTLNLGLRKIDAKTEKFNQKLNYEDNFDKVDAFAGEVRAGKVDKVTGKVLSTNDYTTLEKTKLSKVPDDTNASLAAVTNRVDDIITTPVPTGEVIAQEFIDARQGEASVGANLSKVKEQVTNIPNYEKYKNMQMKLLREFKLKFHTATPMKIITQGDSITFGQDLFSANKQPYTNDGTAEIGSGTTTIADMTYPQALVMAINSMGFIGDLKKRAVGGATVLASYNQWTVNPNAQLHIFMFGHNDSYSGVTIQEYIENYIALIKRTLEWGSAVILLTPPQMQNYDVNLNLFAHTVDLIGELFGIPVFNTSDYIKGYPISAIHSNDSITPITDDGVHFNGVGYRLIGYGVAGELFDLVTSKYKVGVNKHIVLDPYNGNILTKSATYLNVNSRVFGTGEEYASGKSINLQSGGTAAISFECDEDDLLLIPYFQGDTNGRLQIDTNFNTGIKRFSDTSLNDSDLGTFKNSFVFGVGETRLAKPSTYKATDINNTVIRVFRGANIILAKNIGSGGSDSVNLHGFYVLSYNDLAKKVDYAITGQNSTVIQVVATKRDGLVLLGCKIQLSVVPSNGLVIGHVPNGLYPIADLYTNGAVENGGAWTTQGCFVKITATGDIVYISTNALSELDCNVVFNVAYTI